jgi:hypothetical protein
VILASMLFLSGCGTTRELAISHDRMVEVTMQAIQFEGHVKPAEIKRTDTEEKGGRLTMLKSPYIDYSKVEVQIDSREDHTKHPELLVKVLSNDTFYTRHKDLEARLMEVVLLELRAKQHGEESKPTAMAPATPAELKAAENRPPTAEEKAVAPKTEPEKK